MLKIVFYTIKPPFLPFKVKIFFFINFQVNYKQGIALSTQTWNNTQLQMHNLFSQVDGNIFTTYSCT